MNKMVKLIFIISLSLILAGGGFFVLTTAKVKQHCSCCEKPCHCKKAICLSFNFHPQLLLKESNSAAKPNTYVFRVCNAPVAYFYLPIQDIFHPPNC